MATRVLKDDLDIFYDVDDMFECAAEGRYWTDRWLVCENRSLQVGDTVFVISNWGKDGETFLARGQVVAANANDQLRRRGGQYADLSPAYCEDLMDLDPPPDGELLWIRFEVDSVTHMEFPLKIAWLSKQPGCPDFSFIQTLHSGDIIPETHVPQLMHYWDRHIAKLHRHKLAVIRSEYVKGE